jgi:PAS domain S-box-containing protein|nr:ATP-binding protein [Candidatus Krumholzibacteria bacterium]
MSFDQQNHDQEIYRLTRENQRLHRLAQDLKESEDFSRAVFEAAQTGMLIVVGDTDQIMDANRAAANILGHDIENLLGQASGNFLCSGDSRLIGDSASHHLKSSNVPCQMLNKSGQTIHVLLSTTTIKSGNQPLILVSFMDISALRAAEEKLTASNKQLTETLGQLQDQKSRAAQSEKLASIGQLAAGVAHEINNPVGFVTSNLGTIGNYFGIMKALLEIYAQTEAPVPAEGNAREVLLQMAREIQEEEDLDYILDDLDEVLKESLDGVHRIAEIVKNLKSFAREDGPEKCAHNVNEGIETVTKVIWNELKYRCEVKLDLEPGAVIQGHGGQVNQVIMNMMINASHAMPETGGILNVQTRPAGAEVEIIIADNGCGMDQVTLQKVFDPFFTTKDVGQGTGLGLSISHGIVEDHGGRIEVESAPGQGTTFRIFLPAAEAGTDLAPASPALSPEEELIG